MSLIIRINKIIETYAKNPTIFARELDLNPETVRKICNGKTKDPQISFIVKIKNKYPDINLDWLITGEGEMLKRAKRLEPFCERCIEKEGQIHLLKDLLTKKDTKIDTLNQQVGELIQKLQSCDCNEDKKKDVG